jgi:ribosome-associated heat shock protein Hsp15
MRLDKWLWAARFFKTRSLAQHAVAGGRVKLNGDRVKPAHAVKPGDALAVRIEEIEWQVTVRGLAERRGPATEAKKLYEESAAAGRNASGSWTCAAGARTGLAPQGPATKRDRRLMEKFADSADEG